MIKEKSYILGTDQDELNRLGFQHKVWSEEAFSTWHKMGLGQGQKVLDLGCGPGFTTLDMAGITGPNGSATGLDISPSFVKYAQTQAEARGLNASFQCCDLLTHSFEKEVYNAVYARWVFSWIKDPLSIIDRVLDALKPGGTFGFQEYFNWGGFNIYPEVKEVRRVIEACRQSWREMDGEIDISAALLNRCRERGMEILHTAPLSKAGRAGEMVWQWPGTFLKIYSEKLISLGLLTEAERATFLVAWSKMEQNPGSMLATPVMLEVVVRKPM